MSREVLDSDGPIGYCVACCSTVGAAYSKGPCCKQPTPCHQRVNDAQAVCEHLHQYHKHLAILKWYAFFSCIAERVRDIVGQQLEVRKNRNANCISKVVCFRLWDEAGSVDKRTALRKVLFFFELMPCALEAQTVIKTFCL